MFTYHVLLYLFCLESHLKVAIEIFIQQRVDVFASWRIRLL
jgi:hypothetical protein